MASLVTADVPSTLVGLKAKWNELDEVDRALAVRALHGPKLSFRQLARELGCSASLLRNLDTAAQASAEDLELARKRQISIRELIRRAKVAANPPPRKGKHSRRSNPKLPRRRRFSSAGGWKSSNCGRPMARMSSTRRGE